MTALDFLNISVPKIELNTSELYLNTNYDMAMTFVWTDGNYAATKFGKLYPFYLNPAPITTQPGGARGFAMEIRMRLILVSMPEAIPPGYIYVLTRALDKIGAGAYTVWHAGNLSPTSFVQMTSFILTSNSFDGRITSAIGATGATIQAGGSVTGMPYNSTTRQARTYRACHQGAGGGGGDMTQAVHDVTDHATNYQYRTTPLGSTGAIIQAGGSGHRNGI